jgi:hypothetical protein
MLGQRTRLLGRDVTQGAQLLYLVGLGLVYVENLRALPLDDPLARELAGLLNLAMAGLLAAALALRFAYPARRLEGGAHWWWSTAPVPAGVADLSVTLVSAAPPLLMSWGLFAASVLVVGPSHATQIGWWLVPWQALWLTVLGVAVGPGLPSAPADSWIDAALGSGGMLFLAVAVGGVAWTGAVAGHQVIARVLEELGVAWRPGLLLGEPVVPTLLLSLLAAGAFTFRTRGRRAG